VSKRAREQEQWGGFQGIQSKREGKNKGKGPSIFTVDVKKRPNKARQQGIAVRIEDKQRPAAGVDEDCRTAKRETRCKTGSVACGWPDGWR
jgi:hypothetical protein